MGRGVRYLHGLVCLIVHPYLVGRGHGFVRLIIRPYDVIWGAESAIYTASLALSRILKMSDGARSPLFTRSPLHGHASSLRQMRRGVRYLHGFIGLIMHLHDVRCGAESAIHTAMLA